MDEDTLAGVVERARAKGDRSPEHERALETLEAAIREWRETPWDGK